jgi:hypothetical protein
MALPGSPTRLAKFFYGEDFATATLTKTIAVSPIAIGKITSYFLVGWLGGYLTHGDDVQMTATFKDENAAVIGSVLLPFHIMKPSISRQTSRSHSLRTELHKWKSIVIA